MLLQETTTATRGYWARTSITGAGRADITNANPPGAGIAEQQVHMTEIGHCLETVASGVNKLAKIILHFN